MSATETRAVTGAAGQPCLAQALTASRIPGLDCLRAVAVTLVLLDHSGVTSVFNGGIGVEIFFVLSGFLITWMLQAEINQTGSIGLMAFYRRRAARLLPAFYAYVAFGLVYLAIRHMPIPWPAVVAACFYVLNYYQGLTGAATHFLSPCWSLAVEEQFYLLWPFVMLLVVRRGHHMVRTLCWLIVGVWVLRPVLMLAFNVPDAYLYRALETRADHLLVGCLLAVLLRDPAWQARFTRWAALPWLLPLLVAGLFVSSHLQAWQVYKYGPGYALEPVLVALMIPLVVWRSAKAGWTSAITQSRPLVLMGQASYGIYLMHPIVMHPFRTVTVQFTGSYGLGVLVSIVAISVIAHLSFTYFENPLRARLRGPA